MKNLVSLKPSLILRLRWPQELWLQKIPAQQLFIMAFSTLMARILLSISCQKRRRPLMVLSWKVPAGTGFSDPVFIFSGIFFLALSSFVLVTFLSSGVLFFAWLGYGFLRFSLKPIEVLAALFVFGVFFAALAGVGVFISLVVLGLPLIFSLFLFRTFTKMENFWKTLLGGLIYLTLLFLGLEVVGLGSLTGFVAAVLFLFIFAFLDFGISRMIGSKKNR